MDILEQLKKHRLKSVKSSISFTIERDKRISEHAQYVKTLLQDPSELDGEACTELKVSQIYYRLVDEYNHVTSFKLPKTPGSKSASIWLRVAKAVEDTKVDPEVYLKAQFHYFNKTFGRAPGLHQLATEKAKERAIDYAKTHSGKGKIITSGIKHSVCLADAFRDAEKQMQAICRARKMTREEVYEKLVIPGFMLFPKAFLDADPAYKKVIDR